MTGFTAPPGLDSVVFGPDDTTLATASELGAADIWNTRTRNAPQLLSNVTAIPTSGTSASSNGLYSLGYSSVGHIEVTSDGVSQIGIWDTSDPARPLPLPQLPLEPRSTIDAIALTSDGRYLAVANGDRTIGLWDLTYPAAPKQVGELALPDGQKPTLWRSRRTAVPLRRPATAPRLAEPSSSTSQSGR